jgi:tetratricopeptide (TPR) repeat protein
MPNTSADALYDGLIAAFNGRDWPRVASLAARLLPLRPRDAGAHYSAGIANLELQRMPAAIDHLRQAAKLEPARADYLVHLAKALVLARQKREARMVATRAMALKSKDPLILDTLGVVWTQIGDYTSAVQAFRQAAERVPERASYRYNLASALVAAGDLDSAEAEIEACLAIDPKYWRAYMTLSQLRRQSPEHNHVERLASLLGQLDASAVDNAARVCLNMSLAKEYEDLGRYPEAFAHYVRGKAAGGAGNGYATAKDERLFAAIADSFPTAPAATGGFPTEEPIFIIGMPRSGTTLVERIISSHPDVYSAGELLNFAMAMKFLSGSRTPSLIDLDTVERSRDLDWEVLGKTYLGSTRPASGHTARFVDKLPHNFLYAGHIARALPKARIICLRRDPMDTCLSNFRQLFAPKSPYFDYSFDLMDTGRYFVLFDHLMAHWQKVLPGRILQINYEELVEAQEEHSRRLIDFCGLQWNNACLRFEENPSPVATASAIQVRVPMYRSAVKRWKKYGAQLDPLHNLLLEAGITVD